MDEKNALKVDEIQAALAEKRLSLRESLSTMEQEAQYRVRQTLGQVQDKILNTTDDITRVVSRPFEKVQEQIGKVPEILRSKPVKTLAIVGAVGVAAGFMVGRRGRHRQLVTRALLATAHPARVEPIPTYVAEPRRAPARGFFATIAVEAAHQILLNSVFSLLRRRS